jgi:hypothetical protein
MVVKCHSLKGLDSQVYQSKHLKILGNDLNIIIIIIIIVIVIMTPLTCHG